MDKPIPTGEAKKLWQLVTNHKLMVLGIVSTIFFGYRDLRYGWQKDNLQNQIIEIRRDNKHSNETDFALRLRGLQMTATTTEDAMIEYYKTNLEHVEHCKRVQTCNLPLSLAVVKPLPNYLPIAAQYQEKIDELVNSEKETK